MYKSSFTPAQFLLIRRYLPSVKITRPRKYSEYDLLNGILYVLNNGIKWRSMPHDFPPWISCYLYFRKLSVGKYIDLINKILSDTSSKKLSREVKHILVTDSQSVRCTNMLEEKSKGYDGNKKVKGLKRFVLCDVNGAVHHVFTTPANTSEKVGLLNGIVRYYHTKARNKQFQCILADKGFESKPLQESVLKIGFTLYPMKSTKRLKHGIEYDIQQNSLHSYQNKQISKIRWVVEQVFAHLDNFRRLIVCYERKPRFHEAFVKLACISLLVRRMKE
jgi:putative transposase